MTSIAVGLFTKEESLRGVAPYRDPIEKINPTHVAIVEAGMTNGSNALIFFADRKEGEKVAMTLPASVFRDLYSEFVKAEAKFLAQRN